MKNEILRFFEQQLSRWDTAHKNFKALKDVKKKSFKAGNLVGHIQYNPVRAVSTLAKLDKESLQRRPCFLCEENRPTQQEYIHILPGWQMLVNPYPILDYHFTIASKTHIPQVLDIETGFKLAEELPGMVVFFNSCGAGASAPDHLHFQAVTLESLPLIKALENDPEFEPPFALIRNEEELKRCSLPTNVYFWKSPANDEIKFIAVARRAHRPDMFFKELPERRAVSPGAIDMAGVIVTPFAEDFEALNDEDVMEVFRQTSILNSENKEEKIE